MITGNSKAIACGGQSFEECSGHERNGRTGITSTASLT